MSLGTSSDGGSGALVTLGDGLAMKVPSDDGFEKLRAEARWLRWIQRRGDVDIRCRFPRVRAMPTRESPALIVEALPGQSARAAVLAGASEDLLPLLFNVVSFAFERLRGVAAGPAAWPTGEWCAQHLERSLQRAVLLHASVAQVMASQTLPRRAGVTPNPLFDRAREAATALRSLSSTHPVVIHGDLHLGNVLVSPADGEFAFIDPRGGWGGSLTFDPAYDIAKLLHEPTYLRAQMCEPSACGQRASLTAIVDVSEALASRACLLLEPTDPTIAARATLMTGMHLASMLRLPHTTHFDVSLLLSSAARWLSAGLEALQQRTATVDCHRMWTRLHLRLTGSRTLSAK